jgi:hypothetical protein
MPDEPKGPYRFTKEDAVKGAMAANEVRRRKAALKGSVLAKEKFEKDADKLADVLIRAALGLEEYAKLDPKDRAMFAVKALEYGIGKPSVARPEVKEPEEDYFDVGFTISPESMKRSDTAHAVGEVHIVSGEVHIVSSDKEESDGG